MLYGKFVVNFKDFRNILLIDKLFDPWSNTKCETSLKIYDL